jgi:hypothetical protein
VTVHTPPIQPQIHDPPHTGVPDSDEPLDEDDWLDSLLALDPEPDDWLEPDDSLEVLLSDESDDWLESLLALDPLLSLDVLLPDDELLVLESLLVLLDDWLLSELDELLLCELLDGGLDLDEGGSTNEVTLNGPV